MSIGVQPGAGGQAGGVPQGQPGVPKGQVAQGDADAFAAAAGADGKAKDDALGADAKVKKDESQMSLEDVLKKRMAEGTVKQFMESSKEHMQEIKKNMEG